MTSSGLACASCHPEGGDDGHVWHFGESAAVRTQSLVGGVMSTAPFHWEGDLADFSALIDEVYTVRMGGARGALDAPALASWLGALPVPERPTLDGLGRGRALFESAEVGCADCHSGPQLTNGQTVDVGTGGAFQVPRLVGLGLHAPFLHSGCAATLRERFTADASCTGGDQHGHISGLTPSDVDDLVAYLSSL
jgi:hypothetical protein